MNAKHEDSAFEGEASIEGKEITEEVKASDSEVTVASIEEQARQACYLRNTFRTQARDLMKNQELIFSNILML